MKKFINATIYGDSDSTEILVEDKQFEAVGSNLGDADEVIDLEGKLVLPPYVDPHLHLDYIFSGLGEATPTYLAHYTHIDEIKQALDLITANGANVLNIEDYGIKEGNSANFIVLDAHDAYEAVRERAEVLASVRNGEYLFKREVRKNEIEVDFLKK